MKKLTSVGCCSTIAYSEKYICAGGNKIAVFDRKTNEVICYLKGSSGIIALTVDNQFVYAKSSSGNYFVYEIESQEVVTKGYCREKADAPHDDFCLRLSDRVILDVLCLKDDCYYCVKCNFVTKQYTKVCLTEKDYIPREMKFFDPETETVKIFLLQANCTAHPTTNCLLVTVDVKTMQLIESKEIILPHGTMPSTLLSERLLLLKRPGAFYDIDTGETEALPFPLRSNEIECFVKAQRMSDGRVGFISTKKAWIYNLSSHCVEGEYPCVNVSAVECIDGKIYIGTWNGLFCV